MYLPTHQHVWLLSRMKIMFIFSFSLLGLNELKIGRSWSMNSEPVESCFAILFNVNDEENKRSPASLIQ